MGWGLSDSAQAGVRGAAMEENEGHYAGEEILRYQVGGAEERAEMARMKAEAIAAHQARLASGEAARRDGAVEEADIVNELPPMPLEFLE